MERLPRGRVDGWEGMVGEGEVRLLRSVLRGHWQDRVRTHTRVWSTCQRVNMSTRSHHWLNMAPGPDRLLRLHRMPRMTRLELTDKLLKSLIKVLPYYANPSIFWLLALSFSFLKPFLAPRSEYSKSSSALSAGQPFPLPGVIARFAARTAEFLLALYAIHVYVNSKATPASHCPIRLRPRRALISTKTSKRRSSEWRCLLDFGTLRNSPCGPDGFVFRYTPISWKKSRFSLC